MKQSRSTSLIKSLVSTAVGFIVAMAANALVLPFFGWSPTLSENLILTVIYTVISIVRGYALERFYEAMGWRTRMSAFALAVLAERQRQIQVEGWSSSHDDDHDPGELGRAGATYALYAFSQDKDSEALMARMDWPWDVDWYKPTVPRRDLTKAAALIIAEGERLDRNRKRKPAFPIDKGGHNEWPSQVAVRPGPPPASNPRSAA